MNKSKFSRTRSREANSLVGASPDHLNIEDARLSPTESDSELLLRLNRLEEQAFNELVRMGKRISELEQENLKLESEVEQLTAQLRSQARHPLLRILRQGQRLRSAFKKLTLLLDMGINPHPKFTSTSGLVYMGDGAWFALAEPRELSAPISLEPGRYKVRMRLPGIDQSSDTFCDLHLTGPGGTFAQVAMSPGRARDAWHASFVITERTNAFHIRLSGRPQDLQSVRVTLIPVRLGRGERRTPSEGNLVPTNMSRVLPSPDTAEIYREWLRLYPRDFWAPPKDLGSEACFHVAVSGCAPTLREALGSLYSLAHQGVPTIEVSLSPEFLRQVGVEAADQILGTAWRRSSRECGGLHFYLEMLGGDQLSPSALSWYAETKRANPEARLIYSDHDFISPDGRLENPHFKPDWSPILYSHQDYLLRAVAVCEDGLLGPDPESGGRLNLRGLREQVLGTGVDGETIVHIPRVLHHLTSDAGSVQEDAYEPSAARELARASKDTANPYVATRPTASILIPAAAPTEVVSKCFESIIENTVGERYEILVDVNGPHREGLRYCIEGFSDQAEIRVIDTAFDAGEGFNYSRLVNNLARHATGDVLILLNDDTEILHLSWLDEMVFYATLGRAGAVGSKLIYQDGRIQHGGMVLGLGGICAHSFVGYPGDSSGYHDYLRLPREVSAVTAAAMAVEREKFWSVGGFDEQNLAVSFNDVDFCLRLAGAGFVNLFVPTVEIMHYESLSRGHPSTASKWLVETREVSYMRQRWATELIRGDRFYNPNLSLDYDLGGFKLAFPPRDWCPNTFE